MKGVIVTKPGRIEVVDDIPAPEIAEHECLVRIVASGFCNGTDMKIIHGAVSTLTVPFPAALGHEGVGEVIEVGARVKSWRVGDRMTNPRCRQGQGSPYNSMWGNMNELAVVQDYDAMEELGLGRKPAYTGCLKVPSGISPEDAAVILSLKESLSAVRNFGFRPGMDALVYGDGPMGLAMAQFLRLEGAGWLGCVGHWEDRLEKCRVVAGADMVLNSHEQSVPELLGGRRVDLVIDAVGATAIMREGARLLKKGGTVGVTGVLSPGHAELDLLALPHHTRVHMLTFPHREHDVHAEVCERILNGTVNAKDYYSHVLPVDEAPRAMEMVQSREAFKVVLVPGGSR